MLLSPGSGRRRLQSPATPGGANRTASWSAQPLPARYPGLGGDVFLLMPRRSSEMMPWSLLVLRVGHPVLGVPHPARLPRGADVRLHSAAANRAWQLRSHHPRSAPLASRVVTGGGVQGFTSPNPARPEPADLGHAPPLLAPLLGTHQGGGQRQTAALASGSGR